MNKGFTHILLIPLALLILGAAIFLTLNTNTNNPTSPTPQTNNQSSEGVSEVQIGGPFTPGIFEGDLRDLPTAPPYVPPPPFIGDLTDIKVSVEKTTYENGDSIPITVNNESSFSISYYSGPSCDIDFEKKVNGKWESASIYIVTSRRPCGPVELESNEEIKITVRLLDDVEQGTYQAVFSFHEKEEVYSSEFQIN